MIRGKQILYLTLAIIIALAAYLYYVDKERKSSVEKYISNPQVGDVYKIKRDNKEDGESYVYYLKIINITPDGITFVPSKMMSNASVDYLMNHYNENEVEGYTYKELQEIKDGKWKTWQKQNTSIIEIVRK